MNKLIFNMIRRIKDPFRRLKWLRFKRRIESAPKRMLNRFKRLFIKKYYLHIDGLEPFEWCDRDYLMFYASFQILSDFVEKEKPFDIPCDQNSEAQQVADEIKELYVWWKEIYPNTDVSEEDIDLHMLRLMKVRKHLWS